MANPNFKGRQKGSVKKTSMIVDPALGDYKINFDDECYNLIFTDPKTQNEKVVGYFTNLNNALKRVVKNQAVERKPVYTIKEYITELDETYNNLQKLINS
tara:strand:- start:3 stop:302 length:300 start_codon:yes stop_codon:yes gene_type:complete